MVTKTPLILETNGYNLSFYLDFAQKMQKDFVEAEVEFFAKCESTQRICIKSEQFIIQVSELPRLSKYFRDHINNLRKNFDYQSDTFVDYSLMYQIQAFCGSLNSKDKYSCFSLLSMINIGKSQIGNDSIYVGGESTVSLEEVMEFIDSIECLKG